MRAYMHACVLVSDDVAWTCCDAISSFPDALVGFSVYFLIIFLYVYYLWVYMGRKGVQREE